MVTPTGNQSAPLTLYSNSTLGSESGPSTSDAVAVMVSLPLTHWSNVVVMVTTGSSFTLSINSVTS